jgi:hypothetical protein
VVAAEGWVAGLHGRVRHRSAGGCVMAPGLILAWLVDAAWAYWPDAVCSHFPAHVAASRLFGAATHYLCGGPG